MSYLCYWPAEQTDLKENVTKTSCIILFDEAALKGSAVKTDACFNSIFSSSK